MFKVVLFHPELLLDELFIDRDDVWVFLVLTSPLRLAERTAELESCFSVTRKRSCDSQVVGDVGDFRERRSAGHGR